MTSRKKRGTGGPFDRIVAPPKQVADTPRYLEGVVRLPPKPARVAPPKPAPRAPRQTITAARSMAVSVGEPPRFDIEDAGSRIEGRRENLDAAVVRRLRRGGEPIEARLDLHGLSRDEARHEVDAFIGRASVAGARLLLIIHGKGLHSQRVGRVLRDEVPIWLTDAPAAHQVLCFTTARREHGGEGALYVLLRASRARP